MNKTLAQRPGGPISQAAPAGVSDRYEPEYEQMQAEIAMLVSLDDTGVY
jgi:hypothetical protein